MNASSTVPRCPLHVGREMELVESAAPAFVLAPQDGEEEMVQRGGRGVMRHKRKSWKCPVAGCFRVEAYAMDDGEAKEQAARNCPRCGAPSDADGCRRAIGQATCRNCLREAQQSKREVLRARSQRRKRDDIGASQEEALYFGALPAKENEVRA